MISANKQHILGIHLVPHLVGTLPANLEVCLFCFWDAWKTQWGREADGGRGALDVGSWFIPQ